MLGRLRTALEDRTGCRWQGTGSGRSRCRCSNFCCCCTPSRETGGEEERRRWLNIEERAARAALPLQRQPRFVSSQVSCWNATATISLACPVLSLSSLEKQEKMPCIVHRDSNDAFLLPSLSTRHRGRPRLSMATRRVEQLCHRTKQFGLAHGTCFAPEKDARCAFSPRISQSNARARLALLNAAPGLRKRERMERNDDASITVTPQRRAPG